MPGNDRLGSPVVIAAALVGASILGGSWMVKSSLDKTVLQLDEIKTGLAETRTALAEAAAAQPAAAPQRRRGPDPNQRYTLASNGAPARGPATARVKIFEFSDFQ